MQDPKQNQEFYQKYRIETQIGRGASGICYRIQNIQTKCIYAMKKIHVHSIRKNSIKEASSQVTILSKINHPNIIRYHESFADESHLYIVMQYASKGDLHHILKRRKIRREVFLERQVWQMSRQILEALDYLHKNNIVHRDIKTLNIFMDANGKLFLGDLGVSKIIKSDIGLYSRVGTPLYLAPQIIKYEKYDYKADIWGLGCVIYMMTTFNHPFDAKNIITLGQNIIGTQPKPIQTYSQDLNAFVFEMLQKNPSKRPSAQQLLKKYFTNKFLDIQQVKVGNQKQKGQELEIEPKKFKPDLSSKETKEQQTSQKNQQKSNQSNRKMLNNFVSDLDRVSLLEEDHIKEGTSKQHIAIQQHKKVDPSLEETIVLAKKTYVAHKKYAQVTHKNYSHMHTECQINDKQESKVIMRENNNPKIYMRKQEKNSFVNYSSQKKMLPSSFELPNCTPKHNLKSNYLPSFNWINPKYQSIQCKESQKKDEQRLEKKQQKQQKAFEEQPKKTEGSSCMDINKLFGQGNSQFKVYRGRPKSSINKKERHESTMKSIKRIFKKTDQYEFDQFVQTQVLRKPEMIVL